MRADRTNSRRTQGLRRFPAVTALAVAAALTLAGCGDDVPSKAEFTSKIGSVTGGKVDAELAGCVYQKLGQSDGELLLKASQTPNLTEAEDERLKVTLSRCIIEQYEQDNPPSGSNTTTTTDDDQG